MAARGHSITAGFLRVELGIDLRAAHNAIQYALRRGLLERSAVRGVYQPKPGKAA